MRMSLRASLEISVMINTFGGEDGSQTIAHKESKPTLALGESLANHPRITIVGVLYVRST